MSFASGIKRIRDKTFYFDVQLGPNTHTRQTICIHRVGCNSAKFHEIRMFEVPPLLLRKYAMTGLLSHNLFYQLQAKGKRLTILESLKRKTNMANSLNHQPNKQGSLMSLKGYKYIYIYIYIYLWCPSRALASNFSGWLVPLGNTCLLSLSLSLLFW